MSSNEEAAPAHPWIDVRALRFSYGKHQVLRDVNLQFHRGRHYVVAGPNGAGKSTFLDILSNLKRPSHGGVAVMGRPVGDYSPMEFARLLALAPQEFQSGFAFSVREIVAMGRRPYLNRWGGLDGDDLAAVDAAVSAVDLGPMAGKPVTALSGGERRRCIVARALAQSTPILLLDEPTSGLDIGHALSVMAMARELAEGGKLVITVSHDLNLAACFAHEFVFLKEGAVAASGPVPRVFTGDTLSGIYETAARVRDDEFSGGPAVSFRMGNPVAGAVLSPLDTDGEEPRESSPDKPAIILAAFGTSDTRAVHSIVHILERVETAFPGYDVRLAFTSKTIRGIWRERASNAEFRGENPDIPECVYAAGDVAATLARIRERGVRSVLVQSLHVTDGEEYGNLVDLIGTLKPFLRIGLGAPALGVGDGQEQHLERAAVALAPLANKARESGSALVLMGHGNEHLHQGVFAKFEAALRKKYGAQVYIGTVGAPPFAKDIADSIAKTENPPKSVLLAPLMVVAGIHARNDMAGDGDASWAGVFRGNGFGVETHLVGLGSNDSWAGIHVEHLQAQLPAVGAKREDDG